MLVEVMAQTGLKVAMARVECGQVPLPPQHGSSDQHAQASQGCHVVVVLSTRTSGAAGRRWRRQTGRRRDATGRRRHCHQHHHTAGRRRAAGCRRRRQARVKSLLSAPLPSPPLSPRTAGTGDASPLSAVGGSRFE